MQMGCLMVLKKWQLPLNNSSNSTPTFKSQEYPLKINNFANKLWDEGSWLDEGNKNSNNEK